MVNALLAKRHDAGDHWALSAAGPLFVALVHPVFAKYATDPQSTLIRMLDLCRQLAPRQRRPTERRVATQAGRPGGNSGGTF